MASCFVAALSNLPPVRERSNEHNENENQITDKDSRDIPCSLNCAHGTNVSVIKLTPVQYIIEI